MNDNGRLCRRFPELLLFNTRAERKAARTKAREVTNRSLPYAVYGACCLALFAWLRHRVWPELGLHRSTVANALLLVGSVLVISWSGLRPFRHRINQSLRRQLNSRGMPICMKCGYSLRGTTSGVCPECGAVCPPTAVVEDETGPHNGLQ